MIGHPGDFGDKRGVYTPPSAFEASFLSQMMKPMFEGLSTEAPFGGGEAEGTWRGFLVEAMAKQTVKAGGIGLADQVVAQMLKMQEAGEPAA